MASIDNNSLTLASIPDEMDLFAPALKLETLLVLCQVSKLFKEIMQKHLPQAYFDQMKFGKDQWLGIPGVYDVGEEPQLSLDQVARIIEKLRMECPFFNERDPIQPHRFQNNEIKKVLKTHKLILFPQTINGETRTLNKIGKIFHPLSWLGKIFPFPGEGDTLFESIPSNENDAFRNKPAPKSYFALVMMDVAPGSRGTTYEKKESILTSNGYRILSPEEAATSIEIMNLGSSMEKKDYFFGKEGTYYTFTATTDVYNNERLCVGAADRSGVRVVNLFDGYVTVGLAGAVEVL